MSGIYYNPIRHLSINKLVGQCRFSLTNRSSHAVFEAEYDAWGKQTVSLNEISFRRGYTGHEMLNEFDIINMNGRLYDPFVGRFLSPDKLWWYFRNQS